MKILYDAALLPLRAASIVFGAWPRRTPEAALERDQRMARRLPKVAAGGLWIHGASVGEARLVGLLAREIRKRRAPITLAASAVTAAGRAQLPGRPVADAAFFLPLDFPSFQRRAFDAIAPNLVVLVETELWPNMLVEAFSRGTAVVVVNARLAPERLSRYRRFAGLYAPLLRGLTLVGAAGPEEAERFAALGVPRERLRVTGNLKFDIDAPDADPAALKARFAIGPREPVVAAGSTGEGEDALVLDALAVARRARPGLRLLLAPRHADRFERAALLCASRGLRVARVSSGDSAAEADVLLVDTFGGLAALYALADAAFVGGTLVPVGGHNLLEPLAAGVPVLFGPHTGHVVELAQELLRAGAGERVADAAALGQAWAALVANPDERARRVACGRRLIDANRGALDASVRLVLEGLDRSVRQRRP